MATYYDLCQPQIDFLLAYMIDNVEDEATQDRFRDRIQDADTVEEVHAILLDMTPEVAAMRIYTLGLTLADEGTYDDWMWMRGHLRRSAENYLARSGLRPGQRLDYEGSLAVFRDGWDQ